MNPLHKTACEMHAVSLLEWFPLEYSLKMRSIPFEKFAPARIWFRFVAGLALIVLAASALGEAPEQTRLVSPSAWWMVGPYACSSTADFEANEAIENARNSDVHLNQWNNVVGMGGRELRSVVVEGAPTGQLDLQAVLGPVPTTVCAYAGFRVRAEKAGPVTATLTATGPVRWFLNNKLVAESKEAGVQKTPMKLSAGMNCLLAKSWKKDSEWKVGCALEGMPVTFLDVQAVSPSAKPTATTGRRNVALWSEGSNVAVSSILWGAYPFNEHGMSALNDGKRDGSWNSLEVASLPQWAWVRFPGLRKIDEVVVYAGSVERRPLELVGEYTDDGGATFKTLFTWSKPQLESADRSIRVQFPAVETDNVRIRVNKAAIPEESSFAVAQLSEIEVYGEEVAGNGSLAPGGEVQGGAVASELKADLGFKPQIRYNDETVTVSTPWYQLVLDRQRPRINQLQLDSLGKGQFKINLLRRSGGAALVAPLFDRPPFLPDGKLEVDGNVARYATVTAAPGVQLGMALRFHEKSFEMELATNSSRNVPLEGGVFRFDFDFWQTPTTFFGRSSDQASFVTFPCYMHAPDAGTFHVTQSGDEVMIRECASAENFNLPARQFFNITPWAKSSENRSGLIPAGLWRTTLDFAVDSIRPFPEIVEAEPRLNGLPRYALNIAQWHPGKRVLTNNGVSTPCPHSILFYSEMAVYAPILQDRISLMDLVVASVDHYFDGQVAHIYRKGIKVDVTPPGKWTISMDSYGNLLNSAWYAIHTVGGKPLLERWLPRLEALVGHMEAHDADGDGIVDSVDRGDWFDAYNVIAGCKEAHSTVNNYNGLLHLAELEELATRPDKAEHYRARAQLIKTNFLKMFYNPETGVIAGWRDKEGKLHDRMFPWVNAFAICSDILDPTMAWQIMDRLQKKMKEIGFNQYQYGMICNLLPTQPEDWQADVGPRPWQGYMNGSITPPLSNYMIMALRKLGRHEEAERMLWAQVESFDKGTFNAGVKADYMPQRNRVGSAFFRWDGLAADGEGYLPENWHAYAGLFAGHYGIRFDKDGYSLEPWSPLKGKKLPCNRPVMGKIQKTME